MGGTAWRFIPWANTPAWESVSRLSHSQYSIAQIVPPGLRRVRVTEEIEQAIFALFLSGMTQRAIVNHLNDHGVICLSVYKRSKGLKYETPNGAEKPMWSTITIAAMLKNPVYVGDLAQGRNRVKSYKVHTIVAVPEDEQIAAKEKELAKVLRYKQNLYQDWKDEDITRNDYRHMSEDYERQAGTISAVISRLKGEQATLENGVDEENPFLVAFRKYQNIDKLTREILVELIDHIKVYEGGDISVKFNYADEFRRVVEYVGINAPLASVG